MRTTITVDDDVLSAVREIADAHGVPLGTAVSDLLRRALRPASGLATGEDGLPVVTVPGDARPITDEDVARALAEPGFVRLSADPAVVGQPLSPAEAAEVVAALRSMGGHRFWTDAVDAGAVDWNASLSHRHVPDAHLLAVARQHGGRVATLDRRLVERGQGGAVLVT